MLISGVLLVTGIATQARVTTVASSLNLCVFGSIWLLCLKGYLALAKQLSVACLLVSALSMMALEMGIYDPSLLLLPCAYLFTSLLLERHILLAVTLSSLVGVILIGLSHHQAVSPLLTTSPLVDILAVCCLLIVITYLIDCYVRMIHTSLQNIDEARRQAEAANTTKTHFLTMMSHELRSPLNPIFGFTALLKEETANKEHQDYLTIIRQSGEQLLDLIDSILEYSEVASRKLNVEREPVALCEFCEAIIAYARPQARAKHLDLRADCLSCQRGQVDIVLLDRQRVTQVLRHLMGNALKYTSEGAVSMSVQIETGRDQSRVCVFKIQDTGPGIDPRVAESIFGAFSQAEQHIETRRQEGVGIGLTISRELARLMGGDITVQSTPGDGSTFYFSIPDV
jgi:signal transduction histidine kinase